MASQDNRIASKQGLAERLLFEHPRTVGESYAEHAGVAARFGLAMVAGGLRCLVHAVVPAWHQTAASDTVEDLNRQLQQRRTAGRVDYDFVI